MKRHRLVVGAICAVIGVGCAGGDESPNAVGNDVQPSLPEAAETVYSTEGQQPPAPTPPPALAIELSADTSPLQAYLAVPGAILLRGCLPDSEQTRRGLIVEEGAHRLIVYEPCNGAPGYFTVLHGAVTLLAFAYPQDVAWYMVDPHDRTLSRVPLSDLLPPLDDQEIRRRARNVLQERGIWQPEHETALLQLNRDELSPAFPDERNVVQLTTPVGPAASFMEGYFPESGEQAVALVTLRWQDDALVLHENPALDH